MDSSKGSTNLFHKLNPIDYFNNWSQNQPKKNNNFKIWKLEEKRFSAPERFSRNYQETDTVTLGPGAGAGAGCGIGLGIGLLGGLGFTSGPWNQLRLVFGLGCGCGVGAGFGYGHGLGYGSSWKSIKSDVLGFKEKSKKSNPRRRLVSDW
ncbi:Ribosomal protein L11 methyltransferase [Bienertia sinuspersici]